MIWRRIKHEAYFALQSLEIAVYKDKESRKKTILEKHQWRKLWRGWRGNRPPQFNMTRKFYLKFYSEILILLGNFTGNSENSPRLPPHQKAQFMPLKSTV